MAEERQRRLLATVQAILAGLRRFLIIGLAALAVASVLVYTRVDSIIALLRAESLPGFVFLVPTEAFAVRVKLSLFLGLVAALPIVLWQTCRLAARVLRMRVSAWVLPLVFVSYALFLSGLAFGYLCVFPCALKFFLSFASDTLRPMITFSSYVSFAVAAALPFGLVFQLPVVVGVLTRAGVITHETMRKNRGYIIVGAFCLAAVVTPADVFSQVALAIPMIIVFEVSVLVARLIGWRASRRQPRSASGDS